MSGWREFELREVLRKVISEFAAVVFGLTPEAFNTLGNPSCPTNL